MDLTAFLRARLDEDEAYLLELTEIGERKRDTATEADFAANMPAVRELLADPAVQRVMERQVALGYPPPNDVSRVLCEIEAKRAILAECDLLLKVGIAYPDEAGPASAALILRHLAAVYSGHPDYDPEWGR